ARIMHLLPIKVLITSTCLSLAMSHHASLADVGIRVVQTDKGPVRGKVEDGVIEFKGIPFAAPPMGDLRWELPQEPAAWTEVLDATQFRDRKSTRLNSSHVKISYAVFCLKKKKKNRTG